MVHELNGKKNKMKDEIKTSLLTFIKAQDVKHLEAHKLNEIKKRIE